MKKTVITHLLMLALGGALGAGVMFYVFRPAKDVAKEDAAFTMNESKAVASAFKAIIEEFMADETAANAKYLDKVIQISGPVFEMGKRSIILGNDEASINCGLTDEAVAEMANIKTGDEITIKGYCSGFNDMEIFQEVLMTKCVVVK